MKVLFRVDDGVGIGSGHLMRCYALAESVQRSGGKVYLSSVSESLQHSDWKEIDAIIKVEAREIASNEDFHITNTTAGNVEADWLVIDGYSFDTAWLNQIGKNFRVLFIDDLGMINPQVNIILNHNPGAEERYKASYALSGQSLLGLDYFLMREAWRKLHYRPELNRILITLGGDDQNAKVLGIMIALLEDGREFFADVISSSPSNVFHQEKVLTETYSGCFSLHRGPVSLPEFMSRAAVVICGGGVTAIEAISLGITPVIVVLAENQKPGAKYLESIGSARTISLQSYESNLKTACIALDMLSSKETSNNGNHLIDGNGTDKVTTIMKKGLI